MSTMPVRSWGSGSSRSRWGRARWPVWRATAWRITRSWTRSWPRKAARGLRRPGCAPRVLHRRQPMWRHTNSVHRPRLTSDEAMRMWRARDAYRVQSVLVGVIVISLILEALYFVREGCWVTALLTVGPQVLA